MKYFHTLTALFVATTSGQASAFSLSMNAGEGESSRRGFVVKAASTVAGVAAVTSPLLQAPQIANAAPTIYNLGNGVKYAVTRDSDKKTQPQQGDIVAVEYTGYLTSGSIFDGTHAEGKQNALLFKLGSSAVNPGINAMVSEMRVGQKVQAIIPPELAFGDKGICLEDGECLVKPGSTLVYDIFLKKSSIPPP